MRLPVGGFQQGRQAIGAMHGGNVSGGHSQPTANRGDIKGFLAPASKNGGVIHRDPEQVFGDTDDGCGIIKRFVKPGAQSFACFERQVDITVDNESIQSPFGGLQDRRQAGQFPFIEPAGPVGSRGRDHPAHDMQGRRTRQSSNRTAAAVASLF